MKDIDNLEKKLSDMSSEDRPANEWSLLNDMILSVKELKSLWKDFIMAQEENKRMKK